MGVLQDFERRLEGAVEGFFARRFRSGVQPVELAKALQRYAEDTQHVTEDGVVVPNVYRFTLNPRDRDRLGSFGDDLPRELAEVVTRTAAEHDWKLRGPVLTRLEADDDVAFGMFELKGRVEHVADPDPRTSTPFAVVEDPRGQERERSHPTAEPHLRVIAGGDRNGRLTLRGERLTAGRMASCDLTLTDPTVSREHAAFVRRGDRWWVLDLGSTNGTRVNGVRASENPIDIGDRIELGEAVLELRGG